MEKVDVEKFKIVCLALMPKFKPKDGRTFCNFFVQAVCHEFDNKEFEHMRANQIFDSCEKLHKKYSPDTAYKLSFEGVVVLAAWKNPDSKKSGHVALVYPEGPMIFSGKWGIYCPKIAQAGWAAPRGANHGFFKPPTYFGLAAAFG